MSVHLSAAALVLAVLGTAPVISAAQEQLPAQVAQEATRDAHELKLRDGSRLYGTLEHESEDTISFRTITGSLVTVPRTDILSLRQVTGFARGGEFIADDPNRTRLFFAPTARTLPRGQAYFGTFQIMLPFVQVGVTDRFSMGGGTPLVFGFDESERPFWITPKLQVMDRNGLQAAVGAFHIFGLDKESAGIAYGVLTTSGPSASMTVGAGMAYTTDGNRSPVVMIGGDRRVSRNVKMIFESYVWQGGGGIVTAGMRFIGDRLSADIGLGVPLAGNDLFAFPIVNFVYVF